MWVDVSTLPLPIAHYCKYQGVFIAKYASINTSDISINIKLCQILKYSLTLSQLGEYSI